MNDNRFAVEDAFYPNFITEELYVVDEGFKQKQDEKQETLGNQTIEEPNTVVPALNCPNLVMVKFHEPGKAISQYKGFLLKIMAAVRATPNSIDFIDLNRLDGLNPRIIMSKSKATRIITFGVDPKNPDSFKLLKHNGRDVLVACKLEGLTDNKQKKGKLWSLLKSMYQIA